MVLSREEKDYFLFLSVPFIVRPRLLFFEAGALKRVGFLLASLQTTDPWTPKMLGLLLVALIKNVKQKGGGSGFQPTKKRRTLRSIPRLTWCKPVASRLGAGKMGFAGETVSEVLTSDRQVAFSLFFQSLLRSSVFVW